MSLLATLLISLGLGQLASAGGGWWGLSLVRGNRWAGVALGSALFLLGALLLPQQWSVLLFALPGGVLAVLLLLIGGSLNPPPDPHWLFTAAHPAHADSDAVSIPDGESVIPGLLLRPPGWTKQSTGPVVCIVPGAGDTKISFKWRLVEGLLAADLTVLVIDTPGHGDYRQRPMAYPDCLSVVPAAIRFLQEQPDVTGVGVIGISLGGALSIRSLAEDEAARSLLSALVIVATPPYLAYSRSLFYQELWRTLYRAPSLSLLRETSLLQVKQTWDKGGYRSRHTTRQLFSLLDAATHLPTLAEIPSLLVYSRRDLVASPRLAKIMHQAAPEAAFIESKWASHVTLILSTTIVKEVAAWLKTALGV